MSGASLDTRSGPLNVATFDGVRGFVVLTLVLVHVRLVSGWTPNHDVPLALARSLFFAVDYLFVISAFVLFLPVVARGGVGSVRSYAIRRAGRIVPNYYVSLAFAFVVMAAIEWGPARGAPDLLSLLWHVLFLHHETGASGLQVHALVWTLSVIVLFYALLPLIGEPYLRHPVLGLIAGVAAAMARRAAIDAETSGRLFRQFPLFCDDFAVGMTAAWAYVHIRRRSAATLARRLAPPVTAVAVAVLVGVHYLGGRALARGEIVQQAETVWLSITAAAAFAVVVVGSTFLPRWAQWPLTNRVSRLLGEVSYGLFLYHVLIGAIIGELLDLSGTGGLWTFLLVLVILLPASLVAAWISLVTIERPLRERARRFAKRFEDRSRAEFQVGPQPEPVGRPVSS